jgi:hypothetical protein
MATRARKGVPNNKDRSGKGRGATEDRNYLIVSKNRKLVVVSGATGKVRNVDPKNTAKILKLLKERQKASRKIAELISGDDLAFVPAAIIDPDPEDI